MQIFVSPDRPSTAGRFTFNGNFVFGAIVRVASQRILTYTTVRHTQIHMCAGGPLWKSGPKRMNELHVQDIRRCEPHLLDTQLHNQARGHWSINSITSSGRMMPLRSMPQLSPERLYNGRNS